MDAAGGGDLDEAELPLQLRMNSKQAVNGAEALGKPLGVIHAVHAEEDTLVLKTQLSAKLPLFLACVLGRESGANVGIDADRLRTNYRRFSASRHRKTVHV